MEKMNSVNIQYTGDGECKTYMPHLVTADEIVKELSISKERLKEFTDSLYIPHWRIDNGEPLYQKGLVKKWIVKNLAMAVEGKDFPLHINITVEPPLAMDAPISIREIENLREMPITVCPSGIYFLVFEDKLVYIGKSVNPSQRIASHKDKLFDKAYLLPVPLSYLDIVERTLIRLLKPPLNSAVPENINLRTKERDDLILNKYCKGIRFYEDEEGEIKKWNLKK